jgi:hypothetical protein
MLHPATVFTEQASVQITWIPIDEDPAQIEHNRFDSPLAAIERLRSGF